MKKNGGRKKKSRRGISPAGETGRSQGRKHAVTRVLVYGENRQFRLTSEITLKAKAEEKGTGT